MEINPSKGDIIEWLDFDDSTKLGLVLDSIEDVIDGDTNWLYVIWPDGLSHIKSTDIKVISSASSYYSE